MAINGIETLRYGVDDIALCARFFEDFGLVPIIRDEAHVLFKLEEGSKVELRHISDPSLPKGAIEGIGVREVIWGVDSEESLNALLVDLDKDHELARDDDGTIHFVPTFGIPMALRRFDRRPIVYAPDPVNSPGRVNRLNSPRKWRRQSHPKAIQHVVFQAPDYKGASLFMRDRLGFRVTDIQQTFGTYLRADGTNNHHNFLLLNAHASLPGCDGKTRFHHANFGVEDIDELMIGANKMVRQGWEPSHVGLGRHRVDSALFYYMPCPAGGEAEIGTDSDYVDDNWIPRLWPIPLFAYSSWTHEIPKFLETLPEWKFEYLLDENLDALLTENHTEYLGRKRA